MYERTSSKDLPQEAKKTALKLDYFNSLMANPSLSVQLSSFVPSFGGGEESFLLIFAKHSNITINPLLCKNLRSAAKNSPQDCFPNP